MEVGFKTDKGLRRSNNEDACYVLLKEKVFIVADGVGGNNSGEIASRTCVDEIANHVESFDLTTLDDEEAIEDFFAQCIKDVNFKVLELSQRHEENWGMATTVVVAYLKGNQLYVFNVGDSRAYILHDGHMLQITEDHTYVNSLVKAGVISLEEAEYHENRHTITRAVGADYQIETDAFVVTVEEGDRILLCTDGLYGEVPLEVLIETLSRDSSMPAICEQFVDLAKEYGGNDNITMVVVNVTEDDINE